MRRLSLFILTIISLQAFAQPHLCKIDSLQTPDEVETFIHTINSDFVNRRLNTSPTFDSKECQRLAEKLHPPPFFKTDLDHDGYTDLVVRLYTHYSNSPDTSYETVLLSRTGSSSYSIGTFMEGDFDNNWSFAFTGQAGEQPCLYCCRPMYDYKAKTIPEMRIDTLVDKFGYWMNYNANPKHTRIKRIDYQVMSVWNFNGEWIRIDNLGRAGYGKRTAGAPHNFQLIDTASYARLVEMIDYANLPTLKSDYSVSYIFDAAHITLTVTYANGHVKTISDYAAKGPGSLEAINSLIGEIYYNELKK